MTEALTAAVAEMTAALDAIDDPAERFGESEEVEKAIDKALKAVRQRIALQLKHDHERTWREIGEIMGGVSRQRAEQISRAV